MQKDKDGRPILTADDWKTGKNWKKEEAEEKEKEKEHKTAIALLVVVLIGFLVLAIFI